MGSLDLQAMNLQESITFLRAHYQHVLELEAKATKGPWRIGAINYNDIYGPEQDDIVALCPKGPNKSWNGNAIALSRNSIAPTARLVLALIDCVEELARPERSELAAALIACAEELEGENREHS